MIFKNKPNKKYETSDGIIWHSRSCAVVAHIYCIYNNNLYILLGKRGPNCDMPNKINLPSGYFDWNENLKSATCREVYEETGLNLNKILHDNILINGIEQPIYVNSEVNENRQNIALNTLFIFKSDNLIELSIENCEENEVVWSKWIKVNDIFNNKDKYDFAFNHLERIKFSYNLIINKYKLDCLFKHDNLFYNKIKEIYF